MSVPLFSPSPKSPQREARCSRACLPKDALLTPLFAAEAVPTLLEGPPVPRAGTPHTPGAPSCVC